MGDLIHLFGDEHPDRDTTPEEKEESDEPDIDWGLGDEPSPWQEALLDEARVIGSAEADLWRAALDLSDLRTVMVAGEDRRRELLFTHWDPQVRGIAEIARELQVMRTEMLDAASTDGP